MGAHLEIVHRPRVRSVAEGLICDDHIVPPRLSLVENFAVIESNPALHDVHVARRRDVGRREHHGMHRHRQLDHEPWRGVVEEPDLMEGGRRGEPRDFTCAAGGRHVGTVTHGVAMRAPGESLAGH